jgi:hypothetical protein
MMSLRIEKKQSSASKQQAKDGIHPVKVEEGKLSEDSDDEFYDVDKVDPSQEVQPSDTGNADVGSRSQEENYISKEELECLVHGGLPMALRGEVQPDHWSILFLSFTFDLFSSFSSCVIFW